MAPLFHTRADGSADTLSHDITHTGGGERGAAAAPGAEEVAVHHADEAGREELRGLGLGLGLGFA